MLPLTSVRAARLQIDGTEIRSPSDVSILLDDLAVGQAVAVRVLRAADGGKGPQELELVAQLSSE